LISSEPDTSHVARPRLLALAAGVHVFLAGFS
jgi:hypothetical protein